MKLVTCGRKARTAGGPKVRFGTKWPSITSTWIQSAPWRSTAAISAPKLAKSAERIEGAILMRRSKDMGRPFFSGGGASGPVPGSIAQSGPGVTGGVALGRRGSATGASRPPRIDAWRPAG